jgi:putative transposase
MVLLAMGSTFFSLHYHVVFSTKERRPLLRATWRSRLHEYIGGTIRGLGGVAEKIGGVEDHLHLLMSLRTTNAPADFVREIKKASSGWVKEQFDPRFAWQEGYAVFSVSYTHSLALRRYIETQEEHHQKVGFVDELKRLLLRNGVDYDAQYLV